MARVLIVDDQQDLRDALTAVVESDGHEIFEADSGSVVLEKALACRPDIVLMDCNMGGVNGFEALRLLKSTPETSHVPVVMVTVLNDALARARASELGADGFVTKPWGDGELEWRIRRVLATPATSSASGGSHRGTAVPPR